jgi:MraZ protein
MLSRKKQYGWMALGGLICLFALILACKLRDGNKAVAQTDKPAPAIEEKTSIPSPENLGETKDVPKNEASVPLPPLVESQSDTKPKTTEPPPAPGALLLTDAPPAPPLKNAEKPVGVMPLETSSPITSYNPTLPATFSPNSPTTPMDSAKKEPSAANGSPPSPPVSDAPSIIRTSDPPPPIPSAPPMPEKTAPVTPEKLRDLRQPSKWNDPNPPATKPETKVAPASHAEPTPATPSTVAGSEHEAKALPGEPPLAPAPGPVQIYRVRGAESLRDIARRTLGNAERWTDLHKLNPALKTDSPLRSDTVVRLPADACVQADDAEPVKPLPALRPKPVAVKAKVLPLTGTFQCSLDEKHGLTLPRAIRDQFAKCETLLLSPGPDKCLWLTNQAHLERLSARLEESHTNEADVRVFKRLYYAQTEKLSVNADGRVSVPERLAQFAELHQELVLVGIDDHFEVWDAARWRQYVQQKSGAEHATARSDSE